MKTRIVTFGFATGLTIADEVIRRVRAIVADRAPEVRGWFLSSGTGCWLDEVELGWRLQISACPADVVWQIAADLARHFGQDAVLVESYTVSVSLYGCIDPKAVCTCGIDERCKRHD